jgi:formylglycine-generating enzyme required for sulfatase activity
LNVAVAKSGYAVSGSPKTATIYYYVIPIEMVQIQGGTFTMGSPTNEPNRESDETQHSVTLTAFKMSKHQVTQWQYETVMGSNPSAHCSGGIRAFYVTGLDTENFPVERVSWYDAIVFCNKLSMGEDLTPAYRINGSTDPAAWGTMPTSWDDPSRVTWDAVKIVAGSTGYRLPTEAQWEYACRAGSTAAFSWGTNFIDDSKANYRAGTIDANNTTAGTSLRRTTAVGSYAPNAYGLYDMHGNVFEWCWDRYSSSYYSSSPAQDPTGAVSGSDRVLRGGSWNDDGQYLRSAGWSNGSPNGRDFDIGFRLVRP